MRLARALSEDALGAVKTARGGGQASPGPRALCRLGGRSSAGSGLWPAALLGKSKLATKACAMLVL